MVWLCEWVTGKGAEYGGITLHRSGGDLWQCVHIGNKCEHWLDTHPEITISGFGSNQIKLISKPQLMRQRSYLRITWIICINEKPNVLTISVSHLCPSCTTIGNSLVFTPSGSFIKIKAYQMIRMVPIWDIICKMLRFMVTTIYYQVYKFVNKGQRVTGSRSPIWPEYTADFSNLLFGI